MRTSLRWINVALMLLGGCVGDIRPAESLAEGVSDDDEARDEDTNDRPSVRRDAGSSDAGATRDARTTRDAAVGDDEPDDDDDDGDEALPARDGGSADAGRDAGGRDAGGECGDGNPPLARGLRIRELALYQTVKVSVLKDGAWSASRTVPVVQGKRALARLFVDTLPGYTRHAVRGVLRLQNGQSVTELRDERTLTGASTDLERASTFTFDIPAAQLDEDTQLSVALEETSCVATAGSASDARFPVSGAQALEASRIGKLRVVLVPVSVDGRLPDTGAQELANMRAALLAYYPVPDVELTVRSTPVTWTQTLVGGSGQGWSDLLNEIMRERARDRVASDVYYFGIVKPAETLRAYCGRGCILGIAPELTRPMTSGQAGLGAAFGDAQSYETLVHELGHAHGRGHAPCAAGGQINGVDAAFPDRSGAVGTWGWDSRADMLIPPTHKDIMGYCQPNWISPYTYAALATRAQQINLRALIAPAPNAVRFRQLLLYADGSARWGGADESSLPGGEVEIASLRDGVGRAAGEVEVVRIPLSHSGDAFLYVPELAPDVRALVLGDRVLDLAAVAPAR